jgi:hypothetical protein
MAIAQLHSIEKLKEATLSFAPQHAWSKSMATG